MSVRAREPGRIVGYKHGRQFIDEGLVFLKSFRGLSDFPKH